MYPRLTRPDVGVWPEPKVKAGRPGSALWGSLRGWSRVVFGSDSGVPPTGLHPRCVLGGVGRGR